MECGMDAWSLFCLLSCQYKCYGCWLGVKLKLEVDGRCEGYFVFRFFDILIFFDYFLGCFTAR